MNTVLLSGAAITMIFFTIKGIVSLTVILWGGRKVKAYLDKKKHKDTP